MRRRPAILVRRGFVAGPTRTGTIRAVAVLLGIVAPGFASAQSTTWDTILSNSHWYVLQENLLAYVTSGTSFTDPAPLAGSDQTLWNLGTATNGLFTGTAVATLRLSSNPLIPITSTMSIEPGIVTDAGQIRMTFVNASSGLETIGIGQMRTISGTTYMEMQMITGNSTLLTTHWAYMAPYDPDTFTPPSLFPDGTLLSQEWRWTEGSTWQMQSDELFGAAGTGTFTVTDYRNGYFWGPGSGPPSTAAETFTHIGSITPEGNVLFNVLIGGTLTSLAGQITGTGLTGRMALRSYDGSAFGPEAIATVVTVPEPATIALVAVATAAWAAVRAAGRHRSCRRSRSDCPPRVGAGAA
jgi:hypothetical protein